MTDDFVFNDTATTEIYTLSLHDALPIFETDPATLAALIYEGRPLAGALRSGEVKIEGDGQAVARFLGLDRKSTRLNSSHANISYAVFCLKKKNGILNHTSPPLPYAPKMP